MRSFRQNKIAKEVINFVCLNALSLVGGMIMNLIKPKRIVLL